MRSEREDQALRDIKANIGLAQQFTAEHTSQTFPADLRTVYATVRCLEIISEASRRLSSVLKARQAEINWPAVAAVGNIYRHEYGKVEPSIVWMTVRKELPPLLAAIEAELD